MICAQAGVVTNVSVRPSEPAYLRDTKIKEWAGIYKGKSVETDIDGLCAAGMSQELAKQVWTILSVIYLIFLHIIVSFVVPRAVLCVLLLTRQIYNCLKRSRI